MFVTITEITNRTGRDRNYLQFLARTNKIDTRRRPQKPGAKRRLWLLDLDQTIAYLKAHPRSSVKHRPPPWSPHIDAPPPGHLSTIQHQLLSREHWHTVVNLQPLNNGTIHVAWSDGESFIIATNGETSQHQYRYEGQHQQK